MRTKTFLRMGLVILFMVSAWGAAAARPAQTVELTGWFGAIWGDGPADAPQSVVTYWLTTEAGESVALSFEDAAAGWWHFNRQRVTLRGEWQTRPGALPTLGVTALHAEGASPAAPPLPVSTSYAWLSVLCKFKDVAAEPKDQPYFQDMYSSLYPGLDHYWREQSYEQADLSGSLAVGWYTLPNDKSYYVHDGSLDFGRAAQDCTAAADPSVNFAAFAGINLMFNTELDGYAWGGFWYLCLDGLCQYWPMTWEPPWGYENIGVIEHENGHAFGLPHSSGSYGYTYDNQWDVMSDVWSQCYQRGANHPEYGCMGEHTIGYHKDMLGWIPGERKRTVSPGSAALVTLEKLALPGADGLLLVNIPISGSPRFYTVETRRLNGYDSWLAGNAVVIHEVDENRDNPAHVIDIDGNGNTGDAGAMWLPGETFTDATNHISIAVLSETASGYVALIRNGAVAVSQVAISGPAVGEIAASYTFTATIQPELADLPISYHWQISGQAPITHTGGITASVTLHWPQAGPQTIQVTAANAAGSATASRVVLITAPPVALEEITLGGPTTGEAGVPYTFIAAVQPISATLPISYHWQISGQAPITHTGGITAAVTLHWPQAGLQSIQVTAANAAGGAFAAHSVQITAPPLKKIYLPLARK